MFCLEMFSGKSAFGMTRKWSTEAVALDPNRAANIGLAIVLFTELKIDEAFDLDHRLLAEDPSDPEANLLAGEILVQQNRYAEAGPYPLSNCRNLKPELMPGYHALLGRVYAATTGFQKQFRSTRAGLSIDEDGSIHYQLGRLYQMTSDKTAADEAFRESKRLSRQWIRHGRIAFDARNQNDTDSGHP